MEQLCKIPVGTVVMVEDNEYVLFIVIGRKMWTEEIVDKVKLAPIAVKRENGKWDNGIDVDRWFSPTTYARIIDV